MKPFYLLLLLCFGACLNVGRATGQESKTIRIATYNVSLYGKKAAQIRERLSDGEDRQAGNVASVVQSVRPDILLLNEIDFDEDESTAKLLAKEFFAKDQGDLKGITYDHIYSAPSNTGVDSGLDLNNNSRKGEPNDCWGYGVYPGQYAMTVLSKYPLDEKQIRTFQEFLWKDLPGALRPIDPKTNESYYDDTTWNKLRLSSKNHVDVPIKISDELTIHVLACHPTPPVFDGPEDRNGCRNHDEIDFWNHYLDDDAAIKDDNGKSGGLPASEKFVIMGDLNADPIDGDGKRQAINGLIAHSRVRDPMPRSKGAIGDAEGKKASERQKGDPALDTANFGRNGNLRVDFVLPSRSLKLKDSGVFWPPRDTDNRKFISASDHRMVWIEVELP